MFDLVFQVPKSNFNDSMKLSPRIKDDSLFDDMKICINQKPRSEKGFGFTVRGGDDGKPVIVNTVSPGKCKSKLAVTLLAVNYVAVEC